MQKQDVKKVVVCTSMGTSESKDYIPGITRWVLTNPLQDKNIQESLVRQAEGIESVIVRPAHLVDDATTKACSVVSDGPLPTSKVSRADVARFMVTNISSDTYKNKGYLNLYSHRDFYLHYLP